MDDRDIAPPDVPGTAGRSGSTDSLIRCCYEELRRIAASMGRDLPPGATLQPTALVHEAYLRLSREPGRLWENRRHFFGAAAQAMREIIIENHRRRGRAKRGGGMGRVPLDDVDLAIEPPAGDVLAVDEAIERLDRQDPRLGEMVRLRYFAGLSIEETANVLGLSVSTVKRDWRFARAWLAAAMDDEGELKTGTDPEGER